VAAGATDLHLKPILAFMWVKQTDKNMLGRGTQVNRLWVVGTAFPEKSFREVWRC